MDHNIVKIMLTGTVFCSFTFMLAMALTLSGGCWGTEAYAATITVNTTDDELNNDRDCSLREAIRSANLDTAVDACPAGSGADTINISPGIYTLTINGTNEEAAVTGDLDITNDLTIAGIRASATIIDGGGIDRVFDILNPVIVQIDQLTIQNGSISAGSGGIGNTGGRQQHHPLVYTGLRWIQDGLDLTPLSASMEGRFSTFPLTPYSICPICLLERTHSTLEWI